MGEEAGKIFVGGVSTSTTDEEFKNHFAKYGEVTDCVLMKDQGTGRKRGFGFVTYKDTNCVDIVLSNAADMLLSGKKIDPKRCTPRGPGAKPGGPGAPRGPKSTANKIFIGGIGQSTEEDIKEALSSYGEITYVQLMMDKVTEKYRGFGFVTFQNEEAVNKLCGLRFVQILGKTVECKRAEHRPPGGGFPGPGGQQQQGPGAWGDGNMNQGGPQMGGGFNQQQQWNQGGYQQQQPGGYNQYQNYGNYGGGQQQQQPGQNGQYNYNQGAPGGFPQQQQGYGAYGQQGGQPQQGNFGGPPQQNFGQSGYQQGGSYQQGPQGGPGGNFGNQGGPPNQGGYNQQGGYGQQNQGNMGNYPQEASGYGPQRVNQGYNQQAGYGQPGQGGGNYGTPMNPGGYQQPPQQQQPQQQQGNFGGGPPNQQYGGNMDPQGGNYNRQGGGPHRGFHPYPRQ